jgi:hypothetical protein
MRHWVIVVAVTLGVAGCGSRQPQPAEPETAAPETPPERAPEKSVGWSGTQPGEIQIDRWFTPESCSECHDEIYRQWQGTMHASSGRDPLFLGTVRFLRANVSSEVERTALRTCVRCHSGAGHISAGATDAFADLGPLTDLYDRGGTFCHFCHSTARTTPRDGWYVVEPGPSSDNMGDVRGPRQDCRTDGHAVAYSQLHELASFCGTCHEQVHAASDIPVQSTFSEWRDSPYNTGEPATTVVCQDCHMRQIAGEPSTGATDRPDRPGSSSPAIGSLSPQRPHIWVHHVVGANTLVPPFLADDAHGRMAAERLRAAATLELVVPDHVAPGMPVVIEARVTNTGAGHAIPTGQTDLRQMWIELVVTSPSHGITVFESGVIDGDGALPEDTHTFGTDYGNAAGEHVLFSARATQVLRDHRIGPRETVTERFETTAPLGSGGTLEVRARLRYRPAAPQMVTALLGDRAPDIEITDMAQDDATIEVAVPPSR